MHIVCEGIETGKLYGISYVKVLKLGYFITCIVCKGIETVVYIIIFILYVKVLKMGDVL